MYKYELDLIEEMVKEVGEDNRVLLEHMATKYQYDDMSMSRVKAYKKAFNYVKEEVYKNNQSVE
tara:strand:+ start:4761 stop:4952 length:192 start_codon:yes stop_codon:yes gene_type:complete